MTYLPYVIGAYLVFAAVLAWDGLSPWLRYRRTLRMIRRKSTQPSAKRTRGEA